MIKPRWRRPPLIWWAELSLFRGADKLKAAASIFSRCTEVDVGDKTRSPVNVPHALEMLKLTLDQRQAVEHETRVRVGRLERVLERLAGRTMDEMDAEQRRHARGERMTTKRSK